MSCISIQPAQASPRDALAWAFTCIRSMWPHACCWRQGDEGSWNTLSAACAPVEFMVCEDEAKFDSVRSGGEAPVIRVTWRDRIVLCSDQESVVAELSRLPQWSHMAMAAQDVP